MTDMTPQQVQRDNFLRTLAIQPGQALRYWKRLSTGEQMVVVTYMTAYYDTFFARRFQAEANRRARPDLTITVTNNPDWAGAPMKGKPAREWKLQRTEGNTKVYVHPSGDELWVLPAPKAVDSSSGSGGGEGSGGTRAVSSEHPDVQDARIWADNLEERHDALLEQRTRLKNLKNPGGSYPAGPFNEYYRVLAEFKQNLESVKKDEMPIWGDGLTPDESKALRIQTDRINSLVKELEADDMDDIDP